MQILKKAIITLSKVLAVIMFIGSTAYGYTLNDLMQAVKNNKIDKAYFIIKNLDDKSTKTLEIIKLLNEDKLHEAKLLADNVILSNIIYLSDNLNAVIVDKTKEKLYLVKNRNGFPVIVKEFNCITGKRAGDKFKEGDQKTPEGIYLTLEWVSNLPPKYGIGAFVLNYPNLIDKEILRRNGHGIWIHGIEGESRPAHSTNGCVALKNRDLKELRKFINIKKTPIVIVNDLSFKKPKDFISTRNSLIDFLFGWKAAWEDSPKNIERYFSFYSENLITPKYENINDWKNYKREVTRNKKWIKINISNVSINKDGRLLKFGELYLITFDMNYKSNNFNWKGRKLLYLTNEGGKWKILGEESL